MNEDILKKLNKSVRLRDAKNQAAINEFYKDMPPYTEEELMKPQPKWWVNESMAIWSRYMAEFMKTQREKK